MDDKEEPDMSRSEGRAFLARQRLLQGQKVEKQTCCVREQKQKEGKKIWNG